MRLTKTQLNIIDALQNGGSVYCVAGHYYLSRKTDNSFRSETITMRAFYPLTGSGLISKELDRDRWWIRK